MKKVGVTKAKERSSKAHTQLDRVLTSQNHAAFVDAWTDFLIALNAVPVILDASAKGNAASQKWAVQNHLGKPSDPLIQYLRQARNAEEHGLEATSRYVESSFAFGIGQNISGGTLIVKGNHIQSTLKTDNGAPLKVEIRGPHSELVPIVDGRFGTVFPVPTTHLGKAIKDQSPANIGLLGLTYFDGILEEAERMAV